MHSDLAYQPFGTRRSMRCRTWWVISGALQVLTLWKVMTISVHGGVVTMLPSKSALSERIRGTTLDRPKKLLLGGLTPPVDQKQRGDCWLFAVSGVLEDSYRRFGVEHGWLHPGEYLQLSRQAFGIAVMRTCAKHPSAMCPAKANEAGPIRWGNTTEGADERMLFFFRELASKALPDSVCAYASTAAGENGCPGMDAALAANPLQFNVTAADMLYDVVDMQRALVDKQHVLTLGTPMVALEYYLPCTAETAPYYRCNPWGSAAEGCLPCPLDRAFGGVSCCIAVRRPMVSMRGEWHHRRKMIQVGAHAVNVVGYSDTYTDEWGNTGGFIIRNSWSDGLGTAHGSNGRGSHSAAYYMRDVYDLDEALTCPNPHSPRSWALCKDVAECTNPLTVVQAKVARRPLQLRCTDNSNQVSGVCEVNASYFMANLTEFDSDGLFIACFLRSSSAHSAEAHPAASLCVPPLLIDDLASIFTPRHIEHLNDPDVCGYNFLPYSTVEAVRSRLGAVVSSDFDIEWSQESYASQGHVGAATAPAPDAVEEERGRSRSAHEIAQHRPSALNYTLLIASMRALPKTSVQSGALWV